MEPAHLRRLVDLQLVDWTGRTWQLTPIGRRRYECLVADTVRPPAA